MGVLLVPDSAMDLAKGAFAMEPRVESCHSCMIYRVGIPLLIHYRQRLLGYKCRS